MKKLVRTSTVPSTLAVFCREQLKRLSEIYDLTAVSSPGAEIALLQADGINVETVTMERHISLSRDVVSLWKMYRLMVRLRPDAVHSITPKAGLITMLAARLAGVPVRIHTFTGLVWPTATGFRRRLLMAADRLLCACATHVVPEGHGVLEDLKKARITSKPLKVLGYGNLRGIDSRMFDRAAVSEFPDGFSSDTFNFIFVGRIVRDKGIIELVDAFLRLAERFDNVRLWLVGRRETTLDPLPDETVSKINGDGRITEVGEVADVRPYLAASQCLVLPSYREGFPNSVIEAGAMSLPAIVSDISGCNEIVADGINGLIVRPHDADSLLAAMETMVSDSMSREKMAGVAREMIVSRYDKEIVFDALVDFYSRII